MKKRLVLVVVVVLLAAGAYLVVVRPGSIRSVITPPISGALDSLNGVIVYNNGGFSATHGRNVVDGYNIGLKYQCVEFVKRYYFERFDHRMPNSYGEVVG